MRINYNGGEIEERDDDIWIYSKRGDGMAFGGKDELIHMLVRNKINLKNEIKEIELIIKQLKEYGNS